MEDTLGEIGQPQRFSNKAFIGQPYLKMPMLMYQPMIGVKEWVVYLEEMKHL